MILRSITSPRPTTQQALETYLLYKRTEDLQFLNKVFSYSGHFQILNTGGWEGNTRVIFLFGSLVVAIQSTTQKELKGSRHAQEKQRQRAGAGGSWYRFALGTFPSVALLRGSNSIWLGGATPPHRASLSPGRAAPSQSLPASQPETRETSSTTRASRYCPRSQEGWSLTGSGGSSKVQEFSQVFECALTFQHVFRLWACLSVGPRTSDWTRQSLGENGGRLTGVPERKNAREHRRVGLRPCGVVVCPPRAEGWR